MIASGMDRRSRREKRSAQFALSVALATCWMIVLAPRAEAYIDPSAGGMLVQLLLAGTAGLAVLGKLMWSRIKRILGMSDSQTPADAGDSARPHDRI
jgi:hypothetical protein